MSGHGLDHQLWHRFSHRYCFGLLLVAVIAVAFRVNPELYRDLWEDEIIAATHAMQPFWLLPIEVERHDVHPFLYFLQLHVWRLFDTSDVWFRLNSTAWNVLAIGSIGVVGRRLYGLAAGLIAAALFALFPPSVWMALEVRPYSWLYVFIIWGFYYTDIAGRAGFRSWRVLLRLLAICVGIIYSHGVGFLIVFLFGVYALVVLLRNAADYRSYRNWLAVFGAAAVAAVPILIADLMHDANLGGSGVVADVISWVPRMVLPRGEGPTLILLAAGIFLAIVILGLVARPTRDITAVFIVLPLVLAAMLDAAGVRIFKLDMFSAMTAPFIVLVITRLSLQLRSSLRELVVCLCAALCILGSIEFLNNRVETTGFLAAAQMIRANEQPGDLVYVPQQSMFWGMAWYMDGPRWGSALAVSGAPNPSWRKLYAHLGQRLVRLLHLEPTTQRLVTPDGLVLLVGNASREQTAGARRVWLITYPRADLPADFPPATLGTLKPRPTAWVHLLAVALYE